MSRRDHRNVDKMFAEERRRALQARDLLIEHDHETFLSITEYISEENVPQMLQDTEDEDGYSAADHLLDGKFDVARKMLLDKYGAHFG